MGLTKKKSKGSGRSGSYETFDTNDHDAYRSYGDHYDSGISFILWTVSNYSEGAIKTYGNIQK